MKIIFIFGMSFLTLTAHAKVFKCTADSGRVYYQAEQCPSEKQQSQVPIVKFNKDKIAAAQAKSAKELAAWNEQEQLQQEQAQAAQAEQDKLRAQQELTQPYIIDQATRTKLNSNHFRSRGLYYQQADLLPPQ